MPSASVLDIRQVFPDVSAIVQRGAAARPPDDDAARRRAHAHRARVLERRRTVPGEGDGLRDRRHGRRVGEDRSRHDGGGDDSSPSSRPTIAIGPRPLATARCSRCSCARASSGLRCTSGPSASSAFSEQDIPLARHIAVHVALGVSHEQLADASRRAAAARARAERLEARIQALSSELESRSGYGRMAGESPAWKHVVRAATQVAATDTTVLLTGESGTGKEVVARYIHRASAAEPRSFRRRQLRGAAGDAPRIRALRPRARRLHRRGAATRGTDRVGGRRRAAPRRGERDEPVGAGQVPARAAGA